MTVRITTAIPNATTTHVGVFPQGQASTASLEYSLFGVALGKSWDCRLVVKKDGKVVSDTGYFRAVLDPVVEF